MKQLLIASRNQGKIREIKAGFSSFSIQLCDLSDFPQAPEVIETGLTFADNAWLKAKKIADFSNLPVLADDSGLCVDALNGAPGVYSARYSLEQTDKANNDKLLNELRGSAAQQRADGESFHRLSPAQFVNVMVLYDPQTTQKWVAEGKVAGYIIDQPRGNKGFGYDPLFWLPEKKCTMAELSLAEKNAISHRGRALHHLIAQIYSL